MMNNPEIDYTDVTVIGAGLTGLTTAYWLKRGGKNVHVVETDNRIGGQIKTQRFEHYIYETGPSTGAVSTPEVAELMNALAETSQGQCQIETAPDAAKRRLIWKGNRFWELPSGPISAITTPLFRFSDKLRILGEPWRKRGNNPDESVASMAARRLGQSFVDYAVDPFISGVYAGNPYTLVTRYALPKLYALERDYGSFIRGSIAKKKQPKTDRDRMATKKVFSAQGGLSHIPQAEGDYIGMENISLGVSHVSISQEGQGWITTFQDANGNRQQLQSRWVVTTCGAYSLPELLPFVDKANSMIEKNIDYDHEAVHLQWAGQFDNRNRAFSRLMLVIPLTLIVMFILLILAFGNIRQAGLLMSVVPLALFGGMLALNIREMTLNVSSAVGFIALIGVAIQNGVIMITHINNLRNEGRSLRDAVVSGASHRMRPVLLTASVAILGLFPASVSTGIGSDVQRPLATVIVYGLLFATVITLFILPTIYYFIEKRKETL